MKNGSLNLLQVRSLLFFLFATCVASVFCSCNDEEGRITIDNSAPAQVTNVQAVAGPGEVTLSWTNPDSPSFMYIIRKSKFPQNPKRSVRFSGKRTKRSVQKRKARNTQKAETKVL